MHHLVHCDIFLERVPAIYRNSQLLCTNNDSIGTEFTQHLSPNTFKNNYYNYISVGGTAPAENAACPLPLSDVDTTSVDWSAENTTAVPDAATGQ